MKLYRRIILLALSLLVLVSSTGFSVGMHFCAGKISDLSFYGKASECFMEQKRETPPPCNTHVNEKSPQGSCCEDHQLVVDQLESATETNGLVFSKALHLKVIAAIKVVILQLFAPQEELRPAYALYISPSIVQDIPVLLRSFLI